MKKLSVLCFAICFSVTVSAQDLLNAVFGKSLENVNINSKKELYKGQILNKTRNGMGLCKWKDGTRYIDGMLYIGDFSKGEINGYGIQFVPERRHIPNCANSIIYAGYWKNGVKQGEGTCYDVSGEVIYFGKFENDMPVETYPSKSDFSAYHFSFIDYDSGDIYFGETNDGIFDGYGIYSWANGDLWFGKFADGQRKGIGIFLLHNAEWATLNCKDDDCVQITSSLENKERDKFNKVSAAQTRKYVLGLVAELATTVSSGVSLVQNFNNNGTSYSGGENTAGGGCNCANLQSEYTRNKQKASGAAGTAGNARAKEEIGAGYYEPLIDKKYGDNSAGNAAVKSSSNQLVRTCERRMEQLQRQAAKCGCVLR